MVLSQKTREDASAGGSNVSSFEFRELSFAIICNLKFDICHGRRPGLGNRQPNRLESADSSIAVKHAKRMRQ
jgi:hypothetical protein